MRKAIALLIVFTLSCQLFLKIGLLTYFLMNRDYITRTFCVNTDKPSMHCKGKCYLMKKMKETKEQPASTQEKELRYNLPEFVMGSDACEELFAPGLSSSGFSPYSDHYAFIGTSSIFHPPCVLPLV